MWSSPVSEAPAAPRQWAPDRRVQVVVATSVLLSFISFWRAAAIVLNDMGSTAFYIGRIVQQALGKSPPLFILVLMIAWCGLTLLVRGGGPLPPAPAPRNLHFSGDALGWLKGTIWPTFTAVAIMMGFGHSILAMSGEESLAQVYREIEHPKVKNLKRTGMIIFVYSLLFTSLVSFFATAIIPDTVRPKFYDNLISGLAMNVVGPLSLRLLF